jgi:DHA2 family multidrug resistance protein
MTPFKLTTAAKLVIATAVLASLLEIIDTSIVNVAIPTMMGNLGATQEDVSWVVIGYIIANAIVLPASAWMASQFGRRRYYITCILIFTAASVACGLSPNLTTLVIMRVFQGLAGGALLPTSQALIQEQFPQEHAGTGSAIYGMSVMIGPTLGPTLGGYLTDHFGWRMIFNINLPLGLFAAFMAYLYVTELDGASLKSKKADKAAEITKAKPKVPPIDGIGLALLCVGIGCLQYVLERGEADGWFESRGILICGILAALAIPLFIWWELRTPHPIVEVRLFKIPVVRSGTMLMGMTGFMLYGLMFILPIFMSSLLHYDATQIGVMFIPGALVTAFCMPVAGKMLQKVDARALILWSVVMITIMFGLMTQFSGQTGSHDIFWVLMVRGLAMAFLFVPINAVVLGAFRGKELGQVAGLLNLLRQVGGSIGIALINTMLDRNSKQNKLDLINKLSPFDLGVKANLPTSIDLRSVPEAFLRSLEHRVDLQVFVMSFTQMAWVLLLIFLLALIPLASLKPQKGLKAAADAH